MATVQNIIDDVRIRLSDVSDESFEDASLLSFHNEASRQMAAFGVFQDIATVAFAGVSSATFETISSTKPVITVMRVDIAGLPIYPSRLDEEVGFSAATAGTPATWIVLGRTLRLNKIYTGDISAWYTYAPSDKTSVDSASDVPTEWSNAAVNYICYLALRQESDNVNAQAFLDRFNEAMLGTASLQQQQLFGGVASAE